MAEAESNIEAVRQMTSTPSGKRALYVSCLKQYASDNYVAFMCMEQFSRDKRKRQALLICEWFIDNNAPESVGNLMTAINMSGDSNRESMADRDAIRIKIKAIGKTIKDKVANHGGGISGFIWALKQKATTSTRLDGDFFAGIQDEAAWNILAALSQNGGDPDASATPDARWINHIIALKRELKKDGFDPDAMGVYA